ncbi:MAG: polysaccharide pyruvyl transferase CsaB [Fusobacterium sp.]|nr:polysaccharide pyruvyl transferase CsaB [Fusobacterium sp.]
MAKKVAISGYYGFKNFGDELILSILTEKLKDHDVTVFSVNPEFTAQTYGVKTARTFNPIDVIKTIAATDVLISGGGSLFQDATSVKSVIYYSFVLGLAQILGKKTIIFAQGVGPLYHPLSRFLVKHLFKRCDAVSVRDEKSLNLLQGWGINAKLVEDPAYSLTIPQAGKEPTTGVQLRQFDGVDEKFLTNLAGAIQGKPKIFSLQKSLDLEVCKEFAKKTNGEIVEEKLIEELSRVEILVSMRFHALIVALKAGVKCAVINYDPKVKTLAEKYSLPLIEFTDSTDVIAEKIKKARTAEVQACELHLDI